MLPCSTNKVVDGQSVCAHIIAVIAADTPATKVMNLVDVVYILGLFYRIMRRFCCMHLVMLVCLQRTAAHADTCCILLLQRTVSLSRRVYVTESIRELAQTEDMVQSECSSCRRR